MERDRETGREEPFKYYKTVVILKLARTGIFRNIKLENFLKTKAANPPKLLVPVM